MRIAALDAHPHRLERTIAALLGAGADSSHSGGRSDGHDTLGSRNP